MLKYILLYAGTLVIFLVIDFIWLNYVAKNLYANQIGHLLASKPNLIPALIFYLLFVVGVLVFAILPGIEAKSLGKTLILGALFGLLTYATYDLTNLATLKDWPLKVTIIDLIWGTSVSTVTSLAGYLIATKLF